jgi:glycopeptide antibiotics resistance protein
MSRRRRSGLLARAVSDLGQGTAGAGEAPIGLAYATAAAGFVAYAVWGTLFPFDFHAVPLEAAALLFWGRLAADAVRLSLTDLASNVLLFLPIGLFMCAALDRTWSARSITRSGRAALITLATAITLSSVIEFAQVFVSWRTPSVLDVAAEVFGAACGIAIWRHIRSECDALLHAALAMIGRSTRVERILLGCCAVFAIAWCLPADFTLRPAEIADKYEHKRLLLPFAPSPDAATTGELATIAVAAVPLGFAAMLCGCPSQRRRSAMSGALIAALALVTLELIQIPVFSRTTDGTELLAALAGSAAGAAVATFAKRPRIVAFDWPVLRVAGAVLLWVGAAFVFDWWPFHLTTDGPRVHLEAMLWSRAPFRWPATASDVAPGVVLAAVAGVLVRQRLDPRFRRLQTLVVVLFAGAVFTVAEVGRVVLVSGRPTLLSVLLKLSALICGLYLGAVAMTDSLHSRKAQ